SVPTPAPTPAPTPTPAPGSGATLYVDPVAGDDSRSWSDTQSAGTPWQTIHRALIGARPGDIVTLLPGTYVDSADVNCNSLTLRGAGSLGDVVIAPPDGSPGVYVNGFENARVENLVVQGGSQGVLAVEAPGVRVQGVAVVSPATVGIQARDTDGVVVDGCIVT